MTGYIFTNYNISFNFLHLLLDENVSGGGERTTHLLSNSKLAETMMMKYNALCTGRGSARIECTVRVREVGGSNPPAPTS
jgi:hypothetical protein